MAELLKQAIVQYVKDYHKRRKRVPTLRNILKRFKKEGLNFTRFYQLFPGRMPEACRLAGVPVPTERIERTAKATKAAKVREKLSAVTGTPSGCLVLSEEQSKRLLGISHLEKGKDPLIIFDELLDRDSRLRKRYKLSLPKTKLVADFLEVAVNKGWSVSSTPNIVDFLTSLWNAGCMGLSFQQMSTLAWFMKDMQNRKWKAEQIPEFLTKLYNVGVYKIPPETVKKLVRLVEQLLSRKWTPNEFVDYVTDHHKHIQLQERWRSGDISSDELKRRLRELDVD